MKNKIIRCGESIFRILEEKEDNVLIIDCVKKSLPKWISLSCVKDYVEISEEELFKDTKKEIRSELSAEDKKIMHQRFSSIISILPVIGDKKKRSLAMADAVECYGVSLNTVKSYLGEYLVYQNIAVLAPKEKKKKRELTQDEKNMRWALNKFYYTRDKQSLATAYMMMIKEKYCDKEGKVMLAHPSKCQFRYFYEKTKKLQKYYISRDGIKDYQRNNRPLLGDGIQEFANVGTGMLDSTICDIYLVDDAGHLVGRPILLACVDAYSSFCYGYTLLWEGGVYSLRNLMLNVIEDKVQWCRKFGILIDKSEWDCKSLPGVMLTDMGSEYKSENFEQITELGVTLQNLPPYRPELKGNVEKFFDLIQSEFKKYLKGKGVIEPDYQERGAHDYRKDACLTINDFEKIIIRCILYYNTQRVMDNFPYTEEMLTSGVRPFANSIFEYGKEKGNLISVSKEELIMTLLPRATARFTRQGLKMKGMRYRADGYTEQYLKGGEVRVAFNPEDITRIWLIEDSKYHPFDLIEKRFQGKKLSEVETLKSDCKEMIKKASADNLQAKIDLAMHIQSIAQNSQSVEDTKIKDIRKTRKREQRRQHKNFLEGGMIQNGYE